MNLHPQLRKTLSALALIAALLMAIAPVVSRLHASGSVGGNQGTALASFTEVCTASGLKLVDLSAWLTKGGKLPTPVHFGMDSDCGYCSLLHSVALLLLALLLLCLLLPLQLLALAGSARSGLASLFPGWSPRGPPITL